MNAVLNGTMSVHKAGSRFGVPHSTLEYKVKEKQGFYNASSASSQSSLSKSKLENEKYTKSLNAVSLNF